MNQNEIEYMSIIAATIFHGIFTGVLLGGMPLVSLTEITERNVAGICVWLFYGAILYVLVKWNEYQNKKRIVLCLQAVGFGLLTAFAKGCVDFGIMQLEEYVQLTMMQVACFDEIVTVLFGVVLITFLTLWVSKRRIDCNWKNGFIPFGMAIMAIIIYACIVTGYFFQNHKAIAAFDANFEEIQNLDYHFAFKILDMNVWFYVILYILFWWLLHAVTVEKSE